MAGMARVLRVEEMVPSPSAKRPRPCSRGRQVESWPTAAAVPPRRRPCARAQTRNRASSAPRRRPAGRFRMCAPARHRGGFASLPAAPCLPRPGSANSGAFRFSTPLGRRTCRSESSKTLSPLDCASGREWERVGGCVTRSCATARSTARGGARCVGGGGRERGGVEWEEETLEKRLALLECWKWRHG